MYTLLKRILLIAIVSALLSVPVFSNGSQSLSDVTSDHSDQSVATQPGEKSDPDPPPPCCRYRRGNVNGDALDQIDIADLVFLVSYSFNSGPEPPCFEEADVDATGGLDIADIVYLVEYMFAGGDSPVDCP